jgi:N-dimethylarginine dimethylaminohydrolase
MSRRRRPSWSGGRPRAWPTAELYRARGLDVVPVSITEFEKLEGCVTCLSVRLRRS